MKLTRFSIYLILAGLTLLGIGFSIGHFTIQKKTNLTPAKPIRQANITYKYIDPLLAYDFPKANDITQYKVLSEKLEQLVTNAIQNKKAENISVYFKELQKGEWVGIHENDIYSPASLLKVPLMLAYLKIAESKPETLHQNVLIKATSIDNVQNIKPTEHIEQGKTYTVADLIKYMIAYSDNDAAAALRSIIDAKDVEDAYTDLGLKYPRNELGDSMTVKNYALYFRLLYNATYLDRDSSESALKILSETDFTQGLVAGVPNTIVVAHKFGERKIEKTNNTIQQQLHDCGIVYVPNRPYVLCVMTKGSDLHTLTDILHDISKTTYEYEQNSIKTQQ